MTLVSRLFNDKMKKAYQLSSKFSSRLFSSGKDVRFGIEARNLMLVGVDKLADAVESTLGPKGRNALLDQGFGTPKITKDGVTVAKSIEFKDRYENMGASLVKQVANKTNDLAGDGTTTATLLARAIFSEGCRAVAAGMNPMDLYRGINLAIDELVKVLKERSKPISTTEEIMQVATISANDDREIGGIIANAMERVGREGVITVSDGRTLDNELEVVEGMKFDRGYISPYFVTDSKSLTVEFEDPVVLIYDKKISSFSSILPILEKISRENKSLLIIAEDVDSEALTALVLNKLRGGLKVCAIKAPGFGDNRKSNLQDIAVLVGGTVVTEDVGLKLEEANEHHFGRAKRISISKDSTIILDGYGPKEAIEERCNFIREQINNTTSSYEQEKLQERLAKLSGGVAVIKVGGASEVEVGEKKDRVTDALNATRAAVEEGIVPGGGIALLHASKSLKNLIDSTTIFDQKVGIEIIQKAVQRPAWKIAQNSGAEGSVVVGKILENDDFNFGYDAQKGIYTDLFKAGILDPTKVVKTALVDAASVAGLMTTTEALVVELPDEKGSNQVSAGMGGANPYGGGMPMM